MCIVSCLKSRRQKLSQHRSRLLIESCITRILRSFASGLFDVQVLKTNSITKYYYLLLTGTKTGFPTRLPWKPFPSWLKMTDPEVSSMLKCARTRPLWIGHVNPASFMYSMISLFGTCTPHNVNWGRIKYQS